MNTEILMPSISNSTICVHPIGTCTADSICDWHVHNECEFYMELEHKRTFFINESEFTLYKGDIIFINERIPHKTKTHIGSTGILIQSCNDILFPVTDKYLHRYITRQGRDTAVFRLGTPIQKQLAACLNEIILENTNKDEAFDMFIKQSLYKIFAILYRNSILWKPNNFTQNSKRILPVLSYIDEHYPQQIQLQEVSDLLNVDRSHFCRIFKKATNTTFMQYLNFIRICKAEKLLLTTDKTMAEIAEETGFSTPSYFSEVFKKNMSCPPSYYKRIKLVSTE